jgi:hypothetical protein
MNEPKMLKLAGAFAALVLVVLIGLRMARPDRAESPVPRPPREELPPPVAPPVVAPRQALDSSPIAIDEDTETNALALPRDKVEEYLGRHRSAASLLAAYGALQDTNLLNEAAANFPNDPQVQWAMLTSQDLSGADRRKWLEAFKSSAPDNSLANYLSAAEHFKTGDRAAALNEITAASGKGLFKDYALESMIDEQELRRACGQSAMLAMHGNGWSAALLQEMAPLKAVANGVADAQQQLKDSGDAAGAEQLVQMGLALSGRLNGGEGNKFVIGELVGNAIEARMLAALEPNTPYDSLGGKTPTQRKEEMQQSKAAQRELMKVLPEAYGVLNEAEWVSYSDRLKTFGEREALKWLQQRVEAAK